MRLLVQKLGVAALVLPRPCVSEPVAGADEALRLRLLVEAFTWSLQGSKAALVPWSCRYHGTSSSCSAGPTRLRLLSLKINSCFKSRLGNGGALDVCKGHFNNAL